MTPELFNSLKQRSSENRYENCEDRKNKLNKILNWLQNNEDLIYDALFADFKKTKFETLLSELHPLESEIKHAIRHLKKWMKDTPVGSPLFFLGHRSRIRYENKGVVLIISPWNYPFQLAMTPLISAIAAGNTAVIKPSEMTPQTSLLIKKLVQDCFRTDEVSVELGAKEKTEELLKYNFDHVFFTGSTPVGRIIAQNCAERLIPVTLELGGKSPTIVDETADISEAVDKIFWGKYLNRGQTCVAPDYVIIHNSVADNFIKKIKALNELNQKSEKTQFINENYYNRLQKLCNAGIDLRITPLEIIEIADTQHLLLKEEIFGPILPVVRYHTKADLNKLIDTDTKPLSFYIFSNNKKNIEEFLNKYPSGNAGINSTLVQFANHYLPFGGIGSSGMGRAHGYHGFLELSNQRALIEQKFFSFSRKFIMPPYTDQKFKALRWLRFLQ